MAAKRNPTYQEAARDVAAELAVLNASLTGRLDAIEAKIDHNHMMMEERLKPIKDHEDRIRALEDAIGALKIKYDWLTGGSFAASLGALIKTIFGG